jgi:hypothetical protein
VECNGNCDHSASWSSPVRLLSTGSGSGLWTWSAAIRNGEKLRMTFYPRGGPFHYLWCDGGCTDLANWDGYALDLGENSGDYSSLALDREGRPHVAFRDRHSFSLGYLWCIKDCESEAPQWDAAVAEPSSHIGEEHPIQPLPTCVRGSWFGGMRPVLALDSQDNPRIAYDAEYQMECYRNPDNPNDRSTYVETKWWTSRVVFFTRR